MEAVSVIAVEFCQIVLRAIVDKADWALCRENVASHTLHRLVETLMFNALERVHVRDSGNEFILVQQGDPSTLRNKKVDYVKENERIKSK